MTHMERFRAALEKATSVKELILSHNDIGNEGIYFLLPVLLRLERLYLRQTGITAATTLQKLVSTSEKLKVLNLNQNSLGRHSVVKHFHNLVLVQAAMAPITFYQR